MRALGVLFLVAVVAFSGCVAEEAKPVAASSAPTVAPAPAVSDVTGSVSGLVTDDESMPIPGVEVVLLKLDKEAKTDEEGRFTLNEVTPGRQELFLQRVGYAPSGRNVDVVAGEVVEVKVTLKSLIMDRAWHYTETTARDMIAGSYVAVYPNEVQGWKLRWVIKDDPTALEDLFLEVDWNPSTALGDGIRFWAGVPNAEAANLCKGTGHDPYICHPPREALGLDWGCDFRDDPKSCSAEWMFRPGGSAASQGLVGVWPDDKVTVYVSHFFREKAPADFTALK